MQIYFNINHADDLHIPERFENCLNPSGDTKYAAFKYMYRLDMFQTMYTFREITIETFDTSFSVSNKH